MKMKFVIALVALCGIAGIARSQERWQADVKIDSIDVADNGKQLTCKVKVSSNNDDDARQTTVRILLPVEVKFVSGSPNCVASASAVPNGSQGVVTCDIGTLTVGASKTIDLVTTLPPKGWSNTFGAFAWSITPDPDPSNNYRASK